MGEGCDTAIDIGPVDGFYVGLHGADFVRGVCETLHVDVGPEASLFLLVWWAGRCGSGSGMVEDAGGRCFEMRP